MAFVELDEKGRLVLPRAVREEVSAKKFDIKVEKDKQIILTPILPLNKLRGAFKTGTPPSELKNIHDIEKTHFPRR